MANYAYLLATNTKEPCDVDSQAALLLRKSEFLVPLLWFGCFRTLDVNKHELQCVDELNRPAVFEAMTLYGGRSTVIHQFEEFAERLLASRAIALPAAKPIKALLSDLKCVDCKAFQLDCSELQLVVSPEEFDVWLSKGLEFSEKVSSGAWSSILVLDDDKKETLAELFEFSHIYQREDLPEPEIDGERLLLQEERSGKGGGSALLSAVAPNEVATRKVVWECRNWEHSLVGTAVDG
jgi:hypothetical protein